MSPALILACAWCVLANVIAMFPSKHQHWPAAYVLIGFGVPLVGHVVWQEGFWVGLIVLVAGGSVLRWPVFYLTRWLRRHMRI